MPVNGQYTDNELKSIDHRKVKGLSLVGKTNLYTDLKDIPTEFPPSEHINTVHTPVSESNDGYVPKELKKDYLNNLLTFVNVGIKFDANLHQLLLGYQSIDNTWDITDDGSKKYLSFAEGEGASIKIDSTTGEPMFDFDDGYTGTAVGPPGTKGDKGASGKNAMVWYPTLDINGNLSWKLYSDSDPSTIIQKTEWILGIEGKDGKNGTNGKIWIPRVRDSRYLTWVKMEYSDYDLDLSPTFIMQNGDLGEDGDPGLTWLPSVDLYGNLTWKSTTDIDVVNDYTFNFDFEVTDVSIFSGIDGRDGRPQNVYTLGLTKDGNIRMDDVYFFSNNGIYNNNGNLLPVKSLIYTEDTTIVVQTEIEASYYKFKLFHEMPSNIKFITIIVCDTGNTYLFDTTKNIWINSKVVKAVNIQYSLCWNKKYNIFYIGNTNKEYKILPINNITEAFTYLYGRKEGES